MIHNEVRRRLKRLESCHPAMPKFIAEYGSGKRAVRTWTELIHEVMDQSNDVYDVAGDFYHEFMRVTPNQELTDIVSVNDDFVGAANFLKAMLPRNIEGNDVHEYSEQVSRR